MNNMFHAFSIKVPGALLDDKFFFDYSDYDSVLEDQSIDATSTGVKAVAYVRLYRLKQDLSTIQAPIYQETKFGTAGSALVVPQDAEIIVGYGSLENLTGLGIYDDASLEAAKAAAVTAITAMVNTVLNEDHTMYSWLVDKYSRANNPISNTEVTHIGLREDYVTAPAVTPTVTVEYIELKG